MIKIPTISIIAERSGTGKTTLLEKITRELKYKGYKVAIIKHDAHDFEIDKPGKDTWRYAEAGADIVAISSSKKVAFIEKIKEEITLDEIIKCISGVDVILIEGYRKSDKAKIEVHRSNWNDALFSEPQDLLAIASDIQWEVGVPCYYIDDYKGITDEIIRYMLSAN